MGDVATAQNDHANGDGSYIRTTYNALLELMKEYADWQSGANCDVVVFGYGELDGQSREIPCRSSFLISNSGYFRELMQESGNKMRSRVKIGDEIGVTIEVFEQLVEMAYIGFVKVGPCQMVDLISGAAILEMNQLIAALLDLFTKTAPHLAWVWIYANCDVHQHLTWSQKARSFLLAHLEEVIRVQSDSLMDFTEDQWIYLLSDENLCVIDENMLLEVLGKWIDFGRRNGVSRSESFVQVAKYIHTVSLDRKRLTLKMKEFPKEVQKFVKSLAVSPASASKSQKRAHDGGPVQVDDISCKPRTVEVLLTRELDILYPVTNSLMMVIPGASAGFPKVYPTEVDDQVAVTPDNVAYYGNSHSFLITSDADFKSTGRRKLIVTKTSGGLPALLRDPTIWRFDPISGRRDVVFTENRKLKTRSGLSHLINYAYYGAAYLDGCIFKAGHETIYRINVTGQDVRNDMPVQELPLPKFEFDRRMHCRGPKPTLFSHASKLYVFYEDRYYLYCPKTDMWCGVWPLPNSRPGRVVCKGQNGFLYVLGFSVQFASLDKLDPETNKWTSCKSPANTWLDPALICFRGEVMIIEKSQEKTKLKYQAEVYNDDTDSWTLRSYDLSEKKDVRLAGVVRVKCSLLRKPQ